MECILQTHDPFESFREIAAYHVLHSVMMLLRSATLNVVAETVEPTIVSSSKSNTHMHTLQPNSVLWKHLFRNSVWLSV